MNLGDDSGYSGHGGRKVLGERGSACINGTHAEHGNCARCGRDMKINLGKTRKAKVNICQDCISTDPWFVKKVRAAV